MWTYHHYDSYGEKGYAIISRSCHLMFTASKIAEVNDVPILDFTTRVLIPEISLLLIIRDRDETPEQALHAFKESSSYGQEMFNYIEEDDEDRRYAARMVLSRRCQPNRDGNNYNRSTALASMLEADADEKAFDRD